MATYKLEIVQKFGQLHHRFFPSTAPAPEFGAGVADMPTLLDGLASSLEAAKFTKADTVIFRSIGYNAASELREAVRTAKF